MLAVTVFSMGTALMAGAQGFAEGAGFLGKFINGGKAFLNSMLGTNFETVGQAGGGAAATGLEAMDAANAAKGAFTEGALAPQAAADVLTGAEGATGIAPGLGSGLPESTAAGVGNLTPPGAVPASAGGVDKLAGMNTASTAKNAAGTLAAPASEGNWLSKAASAAMDFAKTPSGSNIIGNMIQGAGAGMAAKNQQEFDSRVERMFDDPNNAGMQALAKHDYSLNAPPGLAGASNKYAQRQNRASGRYTPTVPYRQYAYGTGE